MIKYSSEKTISNKYFILLFVSYLQSCPLYYKLFLLPRYQTQYQGKDLWMSKSRRAPKRL